MGSFKKRFAKRAYGFLKRKARKGFKYLGPKYLSRGVSEKYATSTAPVLFRNSVEVTLTGNATGTSGTGYARSFMFDDVGDRASIMDLYDLYQIHSITVRFIPAWVTTVNGSTLNAPMYIAVDYTNSATPASASEMLDYANVKKKSVLKEWKMTFTPHFMQSLGVVSSNEYCSKPTTSFWCTNTDIVAYGLRMWIDPIGSNSAAIGKLIFTYNILAKFQS